MNDGGPAYAGYRIELSDEIGGYPDGVRVAREKLRPVAGMSLRERFAVAIAGGAAHYIKPNDDRVQWARNVLCVAQLLTDEALERRKRDNTKRASGGDLDRYRELCKVMKQQRLTDADFEEYARLKKLIERAALETGAAAMKDDPLYADGDEVKG